MIGSAEALVSITLMEDATRRNTWDGLGGEVYEGTDSSDGTTVKRLACAEQLPQSDLTTRPLYIQIEENPKGAKDPG